MDAQIQPRSQESTATKAAHQEITDKEANLSAANVIIGLMDNIFQWGIDRKITLANGATPLSQLKKLKEELDELEQGLLTEEVLLIRDSIGDMYVVLQQIARLSGISMESCLRAAYDDIKDRTGQMKHGVFVKQADIDLIGEEAMQGSKDADDLRSLIALAKDMG